MTDIPKDVMEAARVVAEEIGFGPTPDHVRVRAIVAAIVAERNRCADVVIALEPLAGPIVHDIKRAIFAPVSIKGEKS